MVKIQQIKPKDIFFKVKYFTISIAFAFLFLLFAFIFSILYISFYYYQLNEQKNKAQEKANSEEVSFENFVSPEKQFLIVSYSCIVLVFVLSIIAFYIYSKIFRFKFSLPFMIIFILVALGIGCIILNSIYWHSIPNICPSNYRLSGDECQIYSFTPRPDDDGANDTYWAKTENNGKTLLKFYNMENYVCFETWTNPNGSSSYLWLNSFNILSGESQGYMYINSTDTLFGITPLPSGNGVDPVLICESLNDVPIPPPPYFSYTTENEVNETSTTCNIDNKYAGNSCSVILPFYIYPTDQPIYPADQTSSLPYNVSSIEFTNNMKMYIGFDNNFYITGNSACVKIITNTVKDASTFQTCVSQNNTLKNGFLIIDLVKSTIDEDKSGELGTTYTNAPVGFISVIPEDGSFSCQRGVWTTEVMVYAPSKTYKPVTGLNSIQLDENNNLKAEDDKLVLSSFDSELHFMLNDNTGDFFTVNYGDKYMWYNAEHEWGYTDS